MQHISYLNKLRQHNPLVHNITNLVSAHFTANGLLAIGASPLMSSAHEEMAELANLSHALAINMGTATPAQIDAMMIAGRAMNALGKPVVFDPVGVAATSYRQKNASDILSAVKVTLIRGNAGEIAHLAGVEWSAHGVDAGHGDDDALAHIAKSCAKKYDTLVALSGATDYLSDGETVITVQNGTPLFPKITASGCLLGGVCGAFLAVADDGLAGVLDAVLTYTVAGELASAGLTDTQSGTFYTQLIDALGTISAEDVQRHARFCVL